MPSTTPPSPTKCLSVTRVKSIRCYDWLICQCGRTVDWSWSSVLFRFVCTRCLHLAMATRDCITPSPSPSTPCNDKKPEQIVFCPVHRSMVCRCSFLMVQTLEKFRLDISIDNFLLLLSFRFNGSCHGWNDSECVCLCVVEIIVQSAQSVSVCAVWSTN